jgi:hypothetical protein
LGDPLIHARFALFIERVNHGGDEPRKAKSWHFIQAALEERYASHARRFERNTLEPNCASTE